MVISRTGSGRMKEGSVSGAREYYTGEGWWGKKKRGGGEEGWGG